MLWNGQWTKEHESLTQNDNDVICNTIPLPNKTTQQKNKQNDLLSMYSVGHTVIMANHMKGTPISSSL